MKGASPPPKENKRGNKQKTLVPKWEQDGTWNGKLKKKSLKDRVIQNEQNWFRMKLGHLIYVKLTSNNYAQDQKKEEIGNVL